MRDKLNGAEIAIKEQLEGEQTPTFTMDISNKPRLKKAARIVFGSKTNEITFEMYRKCLEEKAAMERSESNSFFEDDDDSFDNVKDMMKGIK